MCFSTVIYCMGLEPAIECEWNEMKCPNRMIDINRQHRPAVVVVGVRVLVDAVKQVSKRIRVKIIKSYSLSRYTAS